MCLEACPEARVEVRLAARVGACQEARAEAELRLPVGPGANLHPGLSADPGLGVPLAAAPAPTNMITLIIIHSCHLRKYCHVIFVSWSSKQRVKTILSVSPLILIARP